jgi:hypothetical protein
MLAPRLTRKKHTQNSGVTSSASTSVGSRASHPRLGTRNVKLIDPRPREAACSYETVGNGCRARTRVGLGVRPELRLAG